MINAASEIFLLNVDELIERKRFNPDLVAKLRDVGNNWILMGVENNSPSKTVPNPAPIIIS